MASAGIVYLQVPRPPALDGERWFKVTLATLLRGQVQAADGDAADWEAAVTQFVPYHPAGRLPERKVSNAVALKPTAALPGELALIEALDKLDGAEARWARLYGDEISLEARLADPAELGADYDPSGPVGPGAEWDAVAAWGGGDAAIVAAFERSLDVTWVLVSGRAEQLGGPSLLEALAGSWAKTETVAWDDPELEARLVALAAAGTSMVLVGEEVGMTALLDLLPGNLAIRDRTMAVLSIGGVIGGKPGEDGRLSVDTRKDWMDAWFKMRHLETEVVRLTPYFSLQWVDPTAWPPGVEGQPIEHARFPELDPAGATAETTEVVDLGVLFADDALPTDQVARALITVVTAWVVHRR